MRNDDGSTRFVSWLKDFLVENAIGELMLAGRLHMRIFHADKVTKQGTLVLFCQLPDHGQAPVHKNHPFTRASFLIYVPT